MPEFFSIIRELTTVLGHYGRIVNWVTVSYDDHRKSLAKNVKFVYIIEKFVFWKSWTFWVGRLKKSGTIRLTSEWNVVFVRVLMSVTEILFHDTFCAIWLKFCFLRNSLPGTWSCVFLGLFVICDWNYVLLELLAPLTEITSFLTSYVPSQSNFVFARVLTSVTEIVSLDTFCARCLKLCVFLCFLFF
jgi:hypothetical protein